MAQNETEQKPTQPDYSFIVNQPSGEDPKAGKGKLSGKVIIIIVMAILTLMLLVIGLILPEQKVQNVQTEVTGQQKDEREAVVTDFFGYLAEQDYEQAYTMFSNSEISEDQFNIDWPLFASMIDIPNCKVEKTYSSTRVEADLQSESEESSLDGQDVLYTAVVCPTLDRENDSTTIEIATIKNGDTTIFSYGLVATE